MSQGIGRIAFLAFIWLFSLRYYLECTRLPQFSEKITLTIAFWMFTLLLSYELVHLVRTALKQGGLREGFNPKALRKFFGDKKVHLLSAVIAYIILIPITGFFVTSFFCFCGFSYLLGARSILKAAAQGIIVTGIAFVIFVIVLELPMPKGVFF